MHPLQNETPDGALKAAGQFFKFIEENGLDPETANHMFLSLKMNPQWEASQQQLAANVSQMVSQTNQEISKIINDAYGTRQGVMDNISRRFSNCILGVTDVVDPETGQTWKAEAGHNYYWAKPYGNVVVGTETFTRPDIDFTPLRELK